MALERHTGRNGVTFSLGSVGLGVAGQGLLDAVEEQLGADGDEAPAHCPKCGAPSERFSLLDDKAASLLERSRHTTARHCRQADWGRKIERACTDGREDNLDPGCVDVFYHVAAIVLLAVLGLSCWSVGPVSDRSTAALVESTAVGSAEVELASGRVVVTGDDLNREQLVAAVTGLGYGAQVPDGVDHVK